MHRNLLVSLFIFGHLGSFAQSVNDTVWKKRCVYNTFGLGKVVMKSGMVETAELNYNSDDQSIVFLKGNQIMILTGIDAVDTIYLNGRKYIPFQDKIYEVLVAAKNPFLLSYSNKILPLTATTDHTGSYTQTQNQTSNTVTDAYVSRNYKGNFAVEIIKNLWMKKGNKLYPIRSGKQFLKIAPPQKEKEITKYIQEHHLQLNGRDNETELIRLIEFSFN